MNELYGKLTALHEIVTEFLNRPMVNGNSLEVRFRSALQEQQNMLLQAILLVSQELPDLAELKELLSIIYHDEEAADPLFLEWKRGSTWLGSAASSVLEQMDKQMVAMQEILEATVPIVKDLYGKDQARYIIPDIYRHEQTEMGGVK